MIKLHLVSIATLVMLTTGTARADDTAAPKAAALRIDRSHSKPKRNYLVHANAGMLAANWSAATANGPSTMTTLADRQTLLQMFGVGKFVRPELRLTLSVQLAETVGGAPSGSSTLSAVGIVPWAAYYPHPRVFVGAGPVVAPRSYGKNQLDLGLFTTSGVVFPLGRGFAAGASVQFPVYFLVKTSISAAPATFLAYRF
jgi:hypothetical protein